MKEIRIVIIEDEAVTARNLSRLLLQEGDGVSIVAMLENVQDSVEWFLKYPAAYDLVFSDIRLADGLSFEIFKKINIGAPVIFVTAYDNYAIQAFKSNGIDYILKPFDELELRAALLKFGKLTMQKKPDAEFQDISALLELVQQATRTYRKSFLVSFREKLLPIECQQIAWFHTANELVYIQTTDNQRYIIEETLEELEKQLEPDSFFRANRQYIVNRKAIQEMEHYFNGRLLIKLNPASTEKVLVSKARAAIFKKWLNH